MKNLNFAPDLFALLFIFTSHATATPKICKESLTRTGGAQTSASVPTELIQLDLRNSDLMQEYALKIPEYVGQTVNIEIIYPTSETYVVRQTIDSEKNLAAELRTAALQLRSGEPITQFSDEDIILVFRYVDSRGRSETHVSKMLSIKEAEMQTLHLGRNQTINQFILDEIGNLPISNPKEVQLSILTRSIGFIPVDVRMTRLASQISGAVRSAIAYAKVSVELYAVPDEGQGLVYRYTNTVATNSQTGSENSLLNPAYTALLDTNRKLNRPFDELSVDVLQNFKSTINKTPADLAILFTGVGDGTLFSTAQEYLIENGQAQRKVYGTTYLSSDKLVVPESPTLFTGKLLEHLSENTIQSLKGQMGMIVDQWGDLAQTQFINETLNRMSLMLGPDSKIIFYTGPEEWRYRSGFNKIKTKDSIYSDIVRLPDGTEMTLIEYLKLNLKGFRIKIGATTMELVRNKQPFFLPKLRFLSYDPTGSRSLSRVFTVVSESPSLLAPESNTLH